MAKMINSAEELKPNKYDKDIYLKDAIVTIFEGFNIDIRLAKHFLKLITN